ncbi:profilin, required for normal timing of actin polymerization in response to thermal stress [Dipsacomyces acuminosporus]|nr:profilin, required for normal timing of actin polymerization in response to thermal stress [Dipsacomyces acuminosporus]
MSWQPYVDNNLVGSGKITQAAIYGLDGGVWAQSPNFPLTTDEFQKINAGFSDNNSLLASGVFIGGTKYMAVQVNDDHIHGKKGGEGILCYKTGKTIIVGLYGDSTQPGDANKVIGSVSDYLKGLGFVSIGINGPSLLFTCLFVDLWTA